jgi:2-iminobutanoate/2-iminopropanoate deaminase
VYAAYFAGVKPARTTVQSVLAHSIKIEIDAIAKIRNK